MNFVNIYCTYMISFESDYNNGAHPQVMQHLVETNAEPTATYGFDVYSEQAKQKIRMACGTPDAEIFFLMGGTQTNATVIDGMMRSYEAVVTIDSGHINVHEATAIEASGHKVIALPGYDGKLAVAELDNFMRAFMNDGSREHCAQPGMVYISFPSEYGTIYSKDEIARLYAACQQYSLQLYIDGARLGYALASPANDVTLPWLASHCDAFYIGGTKVGALCGEAVVFPRGNAPKSFFSIIKRHGALQAKGRLVGVQFDALFSNNLYFDISAHAIRMAMQLKQLFADRGYPFFLDSPTNQQFVVIPNNKVRELEQQVEFTHWGATDSHHTVCRFVTSWSTKEEDLQALARILG